jgi:hypothetical protein
VFLCICILSDYTKEIWQCHENFGDNKSLSILKIVHSNQKYTNMFFLMSCEKKLPFIHTCMYLKTSGHIHKNK